MLNRAQLRERGAAETPARTGQFLIERRCADPTPKQVEEDYDPLEYGGHVVWVFLDLIGDPLECGGRTWRIDRSRKAAFKDGSEATVESPVGYYPAVCEHMGHLIE